MNELINDWILRATNDLKVAELLVAEENEAYEIICFHCQQYVEKILKSILTKEQIVFPRTHDLVLLINLLPDQYIEAKDVIGKIVVLNEYAVSARYPGEIVDKDDVVESLEIVHLFKDSIYKYL